MADCMARPGTRSAEPAAPLGFEAKLWAAADALRSLGALGET